MKRMLFASRGSSSTWRTKRKRNEGEGSPTRR
jgi:hypothetical protein